MLQTTIQIKLNSQLIEKPWAIALSKRLEDARGTLGNDLPATAQRESKEFGQHLSLADPTAAVTKYRARHVVFPLQQRGIYKTNQYEICIDMG